MRQARIRGMRSEDLPSATEVLGKAFVTQPNTIALYGRSPASPQTVGIAFTGRLKHLPGQVFVAEVDGRVAGVMRIVEWPGCQASLVQSLRMMPSMLGALKGLGQLRRVMRLMGAWNRHDPREPHWHLDPLGVIPELQGQGIGTQMMRFYCDIVDARGIKAYHETDRPENVPFYEKFDFRVVGEEEINGALNWYMSRPARPDRGAGA